MAGGDERTGEAFELGERLTVVGRGAARRSRARLRPGGLRPGGRHPAHRPAGGLGGGGAPAQRGDLAGHAGVPRGDAALGGAPGRPAAGGAPLHGEHGPAVRPGPLADGRDAGATSATPRCSPSRPARCPIRPAETGTGEERARARRRRKGARRLRTGVKEIVPRVPIVPPSWGRGDDPPATASPRATSSPSSPPGRRPRRGRPTAGDDRDDLFPAGPDPPLGRARRASWAPGPPRRWAKRSAPPGASRRRRST